MRKKMALFFAIVTVIFTYTNALAEEVKLISYYPAPYGAYKELRVGPNDDFIRIFDNNAPTDYGTVIQPLSGTLKIQGILNIFNETSTAYQITVGSSQYNLIQYNAGGSGLKIGDSNASGPVTIEQAFGIKTAFANSAFTVNTGQLPDADSRGNGIRVDHFTKSTSDTYGISVTGNNIGEGKFYAARFNGDVIIQGRADPQILNIPILTADPSNPVEGDLYYNKTTSRLLLYIDGIWKSI